MTLNTSFRLILIICVFLSFAFIASKSALASDKKRPNIILILLDDMGYSDLGSFGGEIDTPNIDQLAAEGIRFRQFYNAGKCEVTRTILMSGQYWHDAGLLIKKGPTLGHVMQSAGYRTYAIGKWHLTGNPVEQGFDRYFGHLKGATDFFLGDKSFRLNKNEWPRPDNFYATTEYTKYASDFIEEGQKLNPMQPFFMYLAHTAPHAPLQALPEDIARFKGRFDKGWDKLRADRIKKQKSLGLIDKNWPIPERPLTIPAWNALTEKGKAFEAKRMEVYAAMIYRVDVELGKLLNKLESIGERENTLIMFLSDNGASPFDRKRTGVLGEAKSKFNTGLGWAWLSNTPYRFYKQNQHMGGNLTSFIANWPAGINKKLNGSISDQPAHIIDILPTISELAGATYPAKFKNESIVSPPGVSILPGFNYKKIARKDPLYFHLSNHWAVIDKNYKLVSAWGREKELYNLKKDRAEADNLVHKDKKRSEKIFSLWQSWSNEKGVKLVHRKNEPVYLPFEKQPLAFDQE